MHYSLCDIVFDIAQNAIESGAGRVELVFSERADRLEVEIGDDGEGMDGAQIERAKDPFRNDGAKHPSRKVGLGIPMLIQTLEGTGGTYSLESEKGKGTRWRMSFDLAHLDTPPVGDRVGLFVQLLCWDGERELTVERDYSGPAGRADWKLSRSELAAALGGLDDAGAIALARDYIESQEGDIGNG